jgi:hypothetical protein
MKKLFGKKEDTHITNAPITSTTTPTTSSVTTSTLPTTTTAPEKVLERKIVAEEPIRHESVGQGVKETILHPISAFQGQPRDRSPTDVRRKEWVERAPVYREGGRETEVTRSMESMTFEERRTPRNVTEFREQVSTLPHQRRHEHYVTTTTAPTLIEKEQAVTVEHIEKGPVVREHIHQTELEEIQPVIHRERERTEVIQVAKPMVERDIRPTQIEEKILPAETRAPVVQGESEEFRRRYMERSQMYKSSTEYAPVEREVIEKAPIIKEHITKKIIEEVQPVIYREVTAPHVIKEVRPIYEKIVEGPVLIEGRQLPVEEMHRHYEYAPTRTEYIERVPAQTVIGGTTTEYREYTISREPEREAERLERKRREKEEKTYHHAHGEHLSETHLKGEPVYEYREVRPQTETREYRG